MKFPDLHIYIPDGLVQHALGSADQPRDPNGRWSGGSADPAGMKAHEINSELSRLDKVSSKATREMIDTGRGYEKPSETRTKTDPLANHINAVNDRSAALRNEVTRRMGPSNNGHFPPGRGFGQIKKLAAQ